MLQKIAIVVGSILVSMALTYKYEGKEALIKAIIEAEKKFSNPRTGALKKKFVQEQISKLPPTLRIFINENTIEQAVAELQDYFLKIK